MQLRASGPSPHHTKKGPGRMPPHRHKHNPPGTKLWKRAKELKL